MSQDYFFETETLDRIMKVTMALASELYVTRDRLRCLEYLLEEARTIDRASLDRFEPNEQQKTEMLTERDRLVESILAPITAPPVK